MTCVFLLQNKYCTAGPPVCFSPQTTDHIPCTRDQRMHGTLISMKYILSKTTAAASSSPLLSRRTKSASGPDHPHFATVRVVSSSVASLSRSPAEFLLMNLNRKNSSSSTAVQSSESKSEKKYQEVLRSTSYRLYFVQQYKSEK